MAQELLHTSDIPSKGPAIIRAAISLDPWQESNRTHPRVSTRTVHQRVPAFSESRRTWRGRVVEDGEAFGAAIAHTLCSCSLWFLAPVLVLVLVLAVCSGVVFGF